MIAMRELGPVGRDEGQTTNFHVLHDANIGLGWVRQELREGCHFLPCLARSLEGLACSNLLLLDFTALPLFAHVRNLQRVGQQKQMKLRTWMS
jgi:hypothetical protein